MNYIRLLILTNCLVLLSYKVNAQDSIRLINNNEKKIGIPITKYEFNKKLSNYIKLMSEWKKFTPGEYVDMVRIYNTISDSDLISKDYYRMYYHIFMVMYVKDVGKSLEAKLMKGMSMYSKKYNVWIGDRPFGNSNSSYYIDTLLK